MSQDVPIECPDLSGRTIQNLKIFRDPAGGTELQIVFIDGTSFVCCVEANLIRCGAGEPEILQKYEIE